MSKRSDMERLSYELRKKMLKVANECGSNVHIGGSFSIIDILIVLYKTILKYDPKDPEWEGRDYFILSKGHCVLAYYTILCECGFISEEELASFQKNGSYLSAHPVMNMHLGIESSNGSLGQGIAMAVGIAKALKIKNMNNRVYVLLGNGECNEGSVWEAAMSAVQWGLDNLTVIVDNNGLQSDGVSENIMEKVDLNDKWNGFGFDTYTFNGHDLDQLMSAFEKGFPGRPRVLIANTVKGAGVSFMENNNEWHHNRVTDSLYEKALGELKDHYGIVD